MKRPAPFLLLCSLLLAACSSSSSTTGTTGASTAGSSITDASSSNNATSGDAATPAIVGGSGGVIVGSGTNTGTDVSSGRSATDVASDVSLFTATFATMDDPTFMLTAASSNMLEVQMGQLAAQQAGRADVRKYGQMMVDHHTKATQDWQNVASAMSVTKPAALMPVHQALLERVTNRGGKSFDEAYMDAMETAHKLDVAMFEAKTKNAQNPAVQSFATRTLPMLRSHSTMANGLEKKVD